MTQPECRPEQPEIVVAENRIIWCVGTAPCQVEATLGDNRVRLTALAATGRGVELLVEAEAPFTLEVEAGFCTFYESAPAGRTIYLLTTLDRTDVQAPAETE